MKCDVKIDVGGIPLNGRTKRPFEDCCTTTDDDDDDDDTSCVVDSKYMKIDSSFIKADYIDYKPSYKRLNYKRTVVPFDRPGLSRKFVDIVNSNLYKNKCKGCKKFHIKDDVVVFNYDKAITYQRLNSIVKRGFQSKKSKVPRDWNVIKNHNNGSMFVNLYKTSPTTSTTYYDYNIDGTAVYNNIFDFPETSKWLQLHEFKNQDRFISDIITVGPWITTRHTDMLNLGGMGLLPSAMKTAMKVWFFEKKCITEIPECSDKTIHESNLKKLSDLGSDAYGSYIVNEYNKGNLDVIVQTPGDFLTIRGGYHHSVFTIYDNEISVDSHSIVGEQIPEKKVGTEFSKKYNVCHLIGFCLPAVDIETSASCYDRGDFDLSDTEIRDKKSFVRKQLSKYYSEKCIGTRITSLFLF